MGFWGTLVAVRADDVPSQLRELDAAVRDRLGDGWAVFAVSEDLTGDHLLTELATLTHAPVLAASIADSDYGQLTGVTPSGLCWQAWLDRRTAYVFERDYLALGGMARADAARRARATIRGFGLPPRRAARQAVQWAAEAGCAASPWRVWSVLRQWWPPSATTTIPLPYTWYTTPEESFAKLLRRLGVGEGPVGHKSTAVAGLIYRKQIRPVVQTGARAWTRSSYSAGVGLGGYQRALGGPVTAAIFGLLGVLTGGVLQFLTQEVVSRRARAVDIARIRLLRTMLDDRAYPWRRLDTCARVIGADKETTVRLLVLAGARASEKEGEGDLWGLLSRHPFEDRGQGRG